MRMSTHALRALIPALVVGVVLICAGDASAATCTFSSSGTWATGSNCATPGANDAVVINSGVTVSVSANESAGSITMNGGTISFTANNPTITDGGAFTSNGNATLTGNGTLTVAG